jgi:hypothetical protein
VNGNQHENGKLASKPSHPAGFNIAAKFEQAAGYFIDDADTIVPTQSKNNINTHTLLSFVCILLKQEFSCIADLYESVRQKS